MNSEWPLVPVGEIAQLFDGPHATPRKTSSGPVFLGISSLQRGQLDLSNTEHLSETDFTKWTRRVTPQADDVVFSYETRIGEVAIIPDGLKCCLGRRMALLRPDRAKLLPKYLLYYFLSDEFQSLLLARTIHGSTVDRLPLKDFPTYPIRVPPLDVQRIISSMLQVLDDRIALLRETNATLEAIAQALFKSWFVDFDPVHARARGEQPAGLAPEVAALFPDSFEESDLGKIPKGWTIGRVEDLMELAYGKALKATARIDGPIPVYGSGGITGYHNESLVNGPSIIVGRKGTVGSLYWEDLPFFPIDTVFYVKTQKPQTYCFYLLQRLGLKDMNTDAAVPGLNRNNVYRLQVLIPPEEVLAAFDNIASVLRHRIFSNNQQSQTLANLRDTLLPRLISGQLRLPDAEAMVSEAQA
ncbi:restriction endonuclease subunit S [Aeromonas veronii]